MKRTTASLQASWLVTNNFTIKNIYNVINFNLSSELQIEPLGAEIENTTATFIDAAVQCTLEYADKSNQADLRVTLVDIASMWNTNAKLNTKTGITSLDMLDVMVDV